MDGRGRASREIVVSVSSRGASLEPQAGMESCRPDWRFEIKSILRARFSYGYLVHPIVPRACDLYVYLAQFTYLELHPDIMGIMLKPPPDVPGKAWCVYSKHFSPQS